MHYILREKKSEILKPKSEGSSKTDRISSTVLQTQARTFLCIESAWGGTVRGLIGKSYFRIR